MQLGNKILLAVVTTASVVSPTYAETFNIDYARQTLLNTYEESRREGNRQKIESFLTTLENVPIDDADRQVISPTQATKSITANNTSTEAIAWKNAVDAWRATQDKLTCDAAIGSLKTLVCEEKDCKVENRYKSQCLDARIDTKHAKTCVTVVDDYLSACFSGGALQHTQSLDFSIGGTTERPLCSIATFEHNCYVSFATAAHCFNDVTTLRSSFNTVEPHKIAEFKRREDGPFAAPDDFTFLTLTDTSIREVVRYPLLKTKQAVTFDPTIFTANNGFLLLRNEIIEKHDLHYEFVIKWPPLITDRSPLCTVVITTDDGVQRHTCQSSGGSSGGALIQNLDEYFAVVGINRGGTESRTNITNASSFASASVLPAADDISCDKFSYDYAQ